MSHTATTLALLKSGWTTALECATKGGCLSLSQRVGDFSRAGVAIEKKWVKTPGGARVLAYRVGKSPQAVATRWPF